MGALLKILDAGFEPWLSWLEDRIASKPLDLELLKKQVNLPEEIKSQGPKSVNAYLVTLEKLAKPKHKEATLKPLNLVRAIFIGNGAAGKTSLIRVLNGEPVVAGEEEMTPGIEIRDWSVGDTGITAKFWDFGGQVMSHATHQFFLRKRCLYVLVLNGRSEINANEEAEYWLEHVKTFGKNADVMLVGNKTDEYPVHLDLRALREKYPNIVDFYPLSCTEAAKIKTAKKYKRYFEAFQDDFIAELQRVGTHQIYFTPAQFQVLEALKEESLEGAFLKKERFFAICEEAGIEPEDRTLLLDLFDKLGEVVHFPEIRYLQALLLNPRWLTYGVYTLLYSTEAQQSKGILSMSQVVDILGQKEKKDEEDHLLIYPEDKCDFIIDAMQKFKLCYPLPGEGPKRVVIPEKLPREQPELTFDTKKEGTLAFEFGFSGFLPRHIMPSVIVDFHEEIENGLVWQNGVILKSKREHATARVQVDYHKRVLHLWVQGEGKREFISAAGNEYDLGKVLGEIMTEERQKQEGVHYTFNGPVGAVGGVGDGHQTTGTVNQNQVKIRTAAEGLNEKLEALLPQVMEYKIGTSEKMAAYNELMEIKNLLSSIDKPSAEQKSKLGSFLNKIKAGTLGAIKLAVKLNTGGALIQSLIQKAEALSRLFLGSPF